MNYNEFEGFQKILKIILFTSTNICIEIMFKIVES